MKVITKLLKKEQTAEKRSALKEENNENIDKFTTV